LPRVIVVLLAALVLSIVLPLTAQAQRSGGGGGGAQPAPAHAVVRPAPAAIHVGVGIYGGYGFYGGYGWGYPFYPYYYSWFPWGYPYGYPGFWYGPTIDQLTGSIKLEVTPRQTEVFVDGYKAGIVDNFDGVFQRLRVRPGEHQIVLFLDGYRTIRQNLYLGVGSDQKVHYAMEKLGPGEVSEPPPPPAGGSDDDPTKQPQGPPPGLAPPQASQVPAAPPQSVTVARTFGTLTVRVQPSDAEVYIDGERWNAPAGQDRLSVELGEGRHHVEIRKAGFSQYAEDVLIRRGATLPLNVSLLRGDGN